MSISKQLFLLNCTECLDWGWGIITRSCPLPSRGRTARNARGTRGAGRTWHEIWHAVVKLAGIHDPHDFGRRKSKVLPGFLVLPCMTAVICCIRCALISFIGIFTVRNCFYDKVKSRFVAISYFHSTHFSVFIYRQVPSFTIGVWMTCAENVVKVLTKKLTEYTFFPFSVLGM